MKKLILLILTLTVAYGTLFSCSGATLYTEGQGELKIVATTFVPFDLAREVAGKRSSITLLQSNGGDMHDYAPTAGALAALKDADIFICVGGVTDEKWVESALTASENPSLKVLRLTEMCEGRLTELEGHYHGGYCEENHHCEHDHEHDHEHEHTEDDGHGHVADEHVWLSLTNAKAICGEIAAACAELDAENASFYIGNATDYVKKLDTLDLQYREAVAGSVKKTLVVADRFPFIYLTAEYGICHYAAFSGCSSETDASFATAVRLIDAIGQNSLSSVIVTESSDRKLAESIAGANGCTVLTLDSMQSVTASQIKDGKTYLGTMQKNLETLSLALV